jgi:hypothetical protein
MKNNNYLILFLGLLTLTSFGARAVQITHTVTYDPNKLSITYDTINGTAYAVLDYEGLISSDSVSKPLLPWDNLTFSIPYNSNNFSAQCQINSYTELNVSGFVYPCQIPHAICDTTTVFSLPDTVIYQSNTFYPHNQCSVSEPYYLSGSNRVVNIIFSPIKYNPVMNKVQLATSISISLSYDIDNNYAPINASSNLELRENDRKLAQSCVINKVDVAGNEAPITINNPEPTSSLPTYNYCILTDKNLEPSFKKIIALKRQKGLSAGTICVEDIVDSGLFPDGDKCYDNEGHLISVISDTAGVVRQYLKCAVRANENPTRYLLIGGKSHNIPIRFARTTIDANLDKGHVPTDMYFSDLDKIWKKYMPDSSYCYDNEYKVYSKTNQGDGNSGVYSYSPIIFVGRLPAKDKYEIDNYSKKLYRYTIDPCHENEDYLLRAFFSNSHGNCMEHESDQTREFANQIFDTVTLVEQSDNTIYPTGADIINELNNTKYGYMSFYAHGDQQSISVYDNVTTYRRHVLSALDSDISIFPTREETGNGLDCLLNKYQPAIGYSIACTTMPFDEIHSFHSLTYQNKYNFGESFVLGKDYGGVAYLGNTRFGYITNSPNLEENFLKTIINTSNYKIGVLEALSKCLYNPYNVGKHVLLTHNLLGDPEFEIWTSEPQHYNNILVARLENGFRVSGTSSTDTIAYCDNYGHQGTVVGSDNNSIFISAHPSSTLMVFNHEHIPYIAPMMLQNCEIINSQYVYASSFSAGKSILPNNTHGNVTIKNGAEYEIEATDDVLLGEGFFVENGATFAIKTPGKVIIDGCVFQSGARVKIESGNVEFVGKFTAERGAKVEFAKYID